MTKKYRIISLIFASAMCIFLPRLYAITIEDAKGLHFVVETSEKARIGKPFKAVIKACDAENNLIEDYSDFGENVTVSTTGTGKITPDTVPASSFKKGKANLLFTYDKAETFDIVVRPMERKPIKGVYVIGPGDTLEISVWEAEGLLKEVIVSPDGMISFPLIGELTASGKTLTELDKEITKAISEYVRDPQVSVMLKKVGGKRVVVFGDVKTPGVYYLAGQGTLMEVIAMAGGFTEDAVKNNVIILRGDLRTNPDIKMLNLLGAVQKGIGLSKDYMIEPNDIVFVSQRLIPSMAYIIKYIVPNIITSAVQQAWN